VLVSGSYGALSSVRKLPGNHHVVQTPEEHRNYELAMTLKTGKLQLQSTERSSPVTHHDPFKESTKKGKSLTDKLMQEYLDAQDEFTEQGTGQAAEPTDPPKKQPPVKSPYENTAAPSISFAPTTSVAPTDSKSGKGKKKKKGKDKESGANEDSKDSESKAPVVAPKTPKESAPSMAPMAFEITFAPTPKLKTNSCKYDCACMRGNQEGCGVAHRF
jgi:hypothetical protein